jgi:steroid delta-isomerase-like uncharacterized protein
MTPAEERNRSVIRQFLAAWNRHDADALEEFVAPDVVRHCPATPDTRVTSVDDLKEFLRRDTAVFPDSTQTIMHTVAEGDLVAVWCTYEGTQQGAMGLIPVTGRRVMFEFAAMFRLKNGKIAEWWVTWDNLTILRALRHEPDE